MSQNPRTEANQSEVGEASSILKQTRRNKESFLTELTEETVFGRREIELKMFFERSQFSRKLKIQFCDCKFRHFVERLHF